MNILESIRKRTGLLVGIVGLALVIFILESLLGSGSSIFGEDMNTVAIINGKKIDRNEFYNKVEGQLNMVRQQRQSNDIDEGTRRQIVDYIFQAYVSDNVIKPQYATLGLSVSEDELYENMVVNPVQTVIQRLTDPKTGMVYEQMARPDGSLDPNKFRAFVAGAAGDMEVFVKQLEEDVANTRLAEKYSSLIKKGVYVTKAEAKMAYEMQNKKLNVSFAYKRFEEVDDQLVKISEDDIKKYYNENKHKFKNGQNSRKIEYVAFNIVPSEADVIAIEQDAKRVAEGFKNKTAAEDSAYQMAESDGGNIVVQDFTRKTMVVRDSSIYVDPVGSVYGPYNEGAYVKIYKLQQVRLLADSARVRHILIGTADAKTGQPKRTKDRAKAIADSLITLIKDKKATFDTLVKTMSEDPGGITNGGDYGWFDENKGFVEQFKNAGLMGVKGNISAVETQFGYHVIEVLDVSKTRHNAYRLAQIFKLIAPSEETSKQIFDNAKQFAGENSTAELFDKGIEQKKLTKRIADNITENDYNIPGVDNARDLIRWVYSSNKGDINLFSYSDKHLVVKLASIKNKGILPLEEVREEVANLALQQKKAEYLIKEFNTKAAGARSIEDIASKMATEVVNQETLSPETHNVRNVGHDDVLIGTAAGIKAGSVTKPTIGELGVFVLKVNSVEAPAPVTDLSALKIQLEQAAAYRADTEFYSALKDKANIENFTGRFE
jgi:peptidyl-prolyl cis-trans isomerase D